jgi:hyperosmotically inducible periplasmic protein
VKVSHAAIVALSMLATACSGTDTGSAKQQANKAVESLGKAAQSVATAAPVLAANDALLASAVKARLAVADIDSATNVGVRAHQGAVTLTGTVRSPRDVHVLGDAARQVGGVKSVQTELRVDPHAPSARTQATNIGLEARVMANIAAQAGLNALSVHASAKAGVVTLHGTVRSPALKTTVLDAARHTPGVHGVVDKLQIVT